MMGKDGEQQKTRLQVKGSDNFDLGKQGGIRDNPGRMKLQNVTVP
jgi:hypothetical protein